MKINTKDGDRLRAALLAVQGTARARIIRIRDVDWVVQQVLQRLAGVSSAALVGTRVTYCQHVYGPTWGGKPYYPSTCIVLQRGVRDWFVVGLERLQVRVIDRRSPNVDLTIETGEVAIQEVRVRMQADARIFPRG